MKETTSIEMTSAILDEDIPDGQIKAMTSAVVHQELELES